MWVGDCVFVLGEISERCGGVGDWELVLGVICGLVQVVFWWLVLVVIWG